jgi:hypothetical protein
MRGGRLSFRQAGFVCAWVAASIAPAACAKVWGIDDGVPYPDASQEEDTLLDRTTQGDVAGDSAPASDAPGADVTDGGKDGGADGADALDGASDGDSPSDAAADAANDAISEGGAGDGPAEACTPDLQWCASHCGTGPDNCGILVGCGQCGAGQACDVDGGNLCVCQSDPGFCTNRCGPLVDNCDASVQCPGCPGTETCNGGTCSGCVPQAGACGSQACGVALNNCQQTVYCGNGGECVAPGDVCMPDDTCCQPDNSACGTPAFACGGSFVNNCQQSITCPGCPTGQMCLSGACCAPPGAPCSTTAGCCNGLTCQGTCQPPVFDGGSGDAGCTTTICSTTLSCCPGADCYSDPTATTTAGHCGPPSCINGGPCMTTAQCCFPQTCVGAIAFHLGPNSGGGGGDGGLPSPDGGTLPPPDGGTMPPPDGGPILGNCK